MTAAIYYHPEAYSTSGPKLMGRNAAGESFLRGFVAHSTASEFGVQVRAPGVRKRDQVIEWRGKPAMIRCDNGPEYVSTALTIWAENRGIKLLYIQPGKPQQNAYVERYNRTVRYDWLGQYLVDTLEDVQEFATRWLWHYNHEHPNMGLGGITPKQKLALVA